MGWSGLYYVVRSWLIYSNCELFVSGSEKSQELEHQSGLPFQHGAIERSGLATHREESARDK